MAKSEGMQTLTDYLVGRDQAEFASQIGVSPAMLSQYKSGYRRPGYDRMLRIAEVTDGAVPVEVWAAHTTSPVDTPPADQGRDAGVLSKRSGGAA